MKKVKNNDKPINTMLGGTDCNQRLAEQREYDEYARETGHQDQRSWQKRQGRQCEQGLNRHAVHRRACFLSRCDERQGLSPPIDAEEQQR